MGASGFKDMLLGMTADVRNGSEAAQSTEATGLAMSGLLPKLT